MKPQQLALLVVGATLGLMLLLLLLYGRPRRAAQEPMPANFHRGDPDAVLEGPRLMKIQAWGLASSIMLAGFLSVYFVLEPFRQASYEKRFLKASIERGRHEFLEGVQCSACHGPKGEGGFASTDPSWPAPPLRNELHRYTRAEVKRIIEQGRPGTPMPAWAVAFGGPLNDQKIEDILNYLESIQVPVDQKYELPPSLTDGRQVFAQKCAVCHGDDARGRALGRPFPTFYAPDLTTVFYRLGVKVILEQRRAADPEHFDPRTFDPRTIPMAEILRAGEEAARNTILKGRQNTPMPAWKDRIRPEQVDAVVAYLRTLQRLPQ